MLSVISILLVTDVILWKLVYQYRVGFCSIFHYFLQVVVVGSTRNYVCRLSTMVLLQNSHLILEHAPKWVWFLNYVMGCPCSLDILITRNQAFLNVWLHVWTLIIIGIISRYLILYNKHNSIHWDRCICILHWFQWVSDILPISIISTLQTFILLIVYNGIIKDI